ncbi:MAG: DUF2807 domain-containing protein [Saprospiraceae bacterium]|nr:DUF2807 domain-containing protein [Saprospiraceae bacterium]
MRLLFSVLFSLCLMSVGFGQSKTLPSFTSISTSGSVKVELVKGDQSKAEYTIVKGSADDLIIEVTGGELDVKIKSKNSFWNRSETKANVTVYYQTLNEIDCSAGSSISSNSEIKASVMDIDASSGAKCQVKVQSDGIKVSTSSGSKVTVSGTTGSATYDASSGARIDAVNLVASDADADVSSGGSISLFASKKLKAEASSGGNIKYRGNPASTNIDSGMSGSISSF